MIEEPVAVEDDLTDPVLLAFPSDERTDFFRGCRRRALFPCVFGKPLRQGRDRRECVPALVGNDLSVDMLPAPENTEARSRVRPSDAPPYPFSSESSPSFSRICPCHTLSCSGSFASLSTNLLCGVLHPFALIGLRGTEPTNCGRHFAEELFIDPFQGDDSLSFDLRLNSRG